MICNSLTGLLQLCVKQLCWTYGKVCVKANTLNVFFSSKDEREKDIRLFPSVTRKCGVLAELLSKPDNGAHSLNR